MKTVRRTILRRAVALLVLLLLPGTAATVRVTANEIQGTAEAVTPDPAYRRIMMQVQQYLPGAPPTEENTEIVRNFLKSKVESNTYEGFKTEPIYRFRIRYPDQTEDVAYCIEFGYYFGGSNDRTIQTYDEYIAELNKDPDLKRIVELIGFWGYEYHRNRPDALQWADVGSNMIWEYLNPGLAVWSDMPDYAAKRNFIFQRLQAGTEGYKPSFDPSLNRLKAGESITLENQNPAALLDAFYISGATAGVTATIDGNKLTVAADRSVQGPIRINFTFGRPNYTGISLVSDGIRPDGDPADPVNNRQAVAVTKFKTPIRHQLNLDVLPAQRFNVTIRKADLINGANPPPQATLSGALYDLIYVDRPDAPAGLKEIEYEGKVFQKGSTVISGLKTDEEGIIRIADLPLGLYDLVETQPSGGYLLNPTALRFEGKYDPHAATHSQDVRLHAGNEKGLIAELNAAIGQLNEKIRANDGRREALPAFDPSDLPAADTLTTYERPALGYLEITKHSEDSGELPASSLKQPEADILFEVTDADGTVVDELLTNDQGWAVSGLLPLGTYRITQKTCIPGVQPLEPFELSIDADGAHAFAVLENVRTHSRLKISKIDSETGARIPCSGVQFRLYTSPDAPDPIIMKTYYPEASDTDLFTANADGEITFPELLPSGTYYLEEVTGPAGYYLDPQGERMRIEITGAYTEAEGRIEEKVVTNQPIKGKIRIEKSGPLFTGWQQETIVVSALLNDKTADQTYTLWQAGFREGPIPGASFDIVAAEDIYSGSAEADEEGKWQPLLLHKKGTVLQTLTTAADGTAESAELPLGAYQLVESGTPDGYARMEPYDFQLTATDNESRVIVNTALLRNEKQVFRLQFRKSFETADWHDYHTEAPSVTLFGLFNQTDLVWGEHHLPADSLVATTTLEEDGSGCFLTTFPGTYYIRELHTHEAYDPAADTEVELLNESDKPEQTTVIRESIPNHLKTRIITVMKLDARSATPLEGATLRLVSVQDGTEEEVGLFTTDQSGRIVVEGLEFGEYYLQEIQAPQGYVNDSRPTRFVINEQSKVSADGLTLTISNEQTRTEISKADVTTGAELPGAHLKVVDERTGETIDEWISSTTPHLIRGLIIGRSYRLIEDLAPLGYQIANAITFRLSKEGKVTSVVMINELNHIRILKTDQETGTPLAGAVFEVYDANGTPFCRGTSDENGIIDIKGLPSGEYTLREIVAPAGYHIGSETISFRIGPDGKPNQTEFIVPNTKEKPLPLSPEEPPRPKAKTAAYVPPVTGDIVPRSVLLITATAAALLMLIGIKHFSKKRNQ